MASKNEKVCHLLSFLVMLVYLRIASTTNIDCGGKPFHCVNSTHFMICVDVGAGISKTVDDFMIQCPSTTVCRGTNYFECEYQTPTTTEWKNRQEDESFTFEIIPHTTTRLSEYANTISVNAQPDMTILPLSTTDDLISTTTKPYIAEDIITTSYKTNLADKSVLLETLKETKDKSQKVSILPTFSKSDKSIEPNTTKYTNESNILQNISINGEKSLNKNEMLYMKPTDMLLHTETTNETSTNQLSALKSQDLPSSYNNNIPTKSTLPDLITVTTDYLNKENIIFKETSEVIRNSSRNGTTKYLPQDVTMNTIISENINSTLTDNYYSSLFRMENETLTTVENLSEPKTEKAFSRYNATESIMKDTTTKDVNTFDPSFKTSSLIANDNANATPVTTIRSFSGPNLLNKSIEATLIAKEPTEDTTVQYLQKILQYTTMTEKNMNLYQDEVKTNTPLGVPLTIPYSILKAETTKNTIIASSEAPNTTMKVSTIHLLQDQGGTETSLPDDFQHSSIVKEIPLSATNNFTHIPESTTLSSLDNSETIKELLTENLIELNHSYKDTKSNSNNNTNLYISSITEKDKFNKSTKGLLPTTVEFTTDKIVQASNRSEFNIMNDIKFGQVEKNNSSNTDVGLPTLSWLEVKNVSTTENPIVAITSPLPFFSYLNSEISPTNQITSVEITKKIPTEMPHLPNNAVNHSPKYNTSLKKALSPEVYDADQMNRSKENTTRINNMPIMTQITDINIIKKTTAEASLEFSNITNEYTKILSQGQMTEAKSFTESTSSKTITYITNENNTANTFTYKNMQPASSVVATSGIPNNNLYIDNINTSTNMLKTNDLHPKHDLYSSRTEMPKTLVSLSNDNNIINITNPFIIVSDTLTTSNGLYEKEPFLSENLTSVKVENFITKRIITEFNTMNTNITHNGKIPPLNDTVQDQYTTTTRYRSNSDGRFFLADTEIFGDRDKKGSTINPVTEDLEVQTKVTDVYNKKYNSDITEITTIPESKLVIEIYPTVRPSDIVLSNKVDKGNNKSTEFVTAKNFGLKHGQIEDKKQKMQVVLETTGINLNTSNIHEEKSNLAYVGNHKQDPAVEPLKAILLDKIIFFASKINTTINAPVIENAGIVFENNYNITNTKDVVMDDTVRIKVIEETVVDSDFASVTTVNYNFTTINPQIVPERVNIPKGIYYKDMISTQPTQETTAHSVLSSDSTNKSEVSASENMTTMNSQIVLDRKENTFKNQNNFGNMKGILISDTMTTQPITTSIKAFTNEVKGSSSNPIPTTSLQLVTASTSTVSINNNDVLYNNEINTPIIKDVVDHPILVLPTSADEIKGSTSNIITTTNQQFTTESTEKLLNKINNANIKIDSIISDATEARLDKETVSQIGLGAATPVSIYHYIVSDSTKVNPQILSKSTGNALKVNNNNLENNVDALNSNLLITKSAQKSIDLYALTLSTPPSIDTVIGSTKKIFGNSTIVTNTPSTQSAQDTITHSVLGSFIPATKDQIEVPESNKITTMNPLITTESTGKLFQNSNNFNVIKYTTAHSTLGTSTAASTDLFKVNYPEIVSGTTGNMFQYNNNNKFKNNVDMNNNAVDIQSNKEAPLHSNLTSSTIAPTDEIKVLDRYTLTTINPHVVTRRMDKMLENTKKLVSEGQEYTLVHRSSGSNVTMISFGGTKHNEFNVLQNEAVPFSTPKLNTENISIKTAITNNKSSHEFNKISYENFITEVPVSTVPTQLQNRKNPNDPLSLKVSETLNKHHFAIHNMQKIANKNDDFFVVPFKQSTNKSHEQLLKQSTVPNTFTLGRVLQNKLQNFTIGTSDYKRTANKDLFTCQNRFRGRYSDENDCRKFYICIGRIQPLLGECPINTVFSEIKKQCTKNLSHCIRHNQFRCIQSGRFVDALNNNAYYICVKYNNAYVRFQFHCQGGYHLNENSVKCVRDQQISSKSIDNDSNKASGQGTVENKSKEKDRIQNAKKNMCTKEGKFPDPHDCRKYFVCSKKSKSVFRRKTKKCDSDEVFHPEKKKCVDNDSYECD